MAIPLTDNFPLSLHDALPILSDLHWADDIVLERMDELLERVANQPFVLIATARHSLLERWSPKPGRHNAVVLNLDRKSTRLNSSHLGISYAVFCLKKKNLKGA